ncbi:hypothetical protein [Actinomadura pelletieri]|uniref:hypothetical protein n=1 Tax=Actinomadura pelletieri TaxID=111805 RepID=UPI0011C399FD|nr:hypothetical protein [Actinomadura pelletieri]
MVDIEYGVDRSRRVQRNVNPVVLVILMSGDTSSDIVELGSRCYQQGSLGSLARGRHGSHGIVRVAWSAVARICG